MYLRGVDNLDISAGRPSKKKKESKVKSNYRCKIAKKTYMYKTLSFPFLPCLGDFFFSDIIFLHLSLFKEHLLQTHFASKKCFHPYIVIKSKGIEI